MLDTKSKAIVRKLIRKHYGHCNLALIREDLKSKSKFEFGCNFYAEEVKGGVMLSYTSNKNCFAEFLVSLQCVGSLNQMALTKKDLTKAGILRGCHNHYAF